MRPLVWIEYDREGFFVIGPRWKFADLRHHMKYSKVPASVTKRTHGAACTL